MRYGFVIDQRKCIGCHACTVACKEENQVPLGVNRTWVKYIEKGTFPDTRRYFSVMRCNHCDNAPCVAICPTVALYRRPDGIVDFDGDRCIGCKSCMQACPYDALYIDPETQTAAKCHYCAHRVEVGLEPACVIVCPVQAIVPGDLDDPGSKIARLVAGQQTAVRKPEQGTQPKLFYLGADEASLTPAMQERGSGYLFAEGSEIPVPGRSNVARATSPVGHDDIDLLRMARTVYDVAHPERPWGGKVSGYLWTKSIAAGALLVAAFATIGGLSAAGPVAALAAPVISLLFLALTTALLVLDLKRPERFLYLLFKPNWRSWLVWGGFILMAHGLLAALWLAAGWRQDLGALYLLAWPTVLVTASAVRRSVMASLISRSRSPRWSQRFRYYIPARSARSCRTTCEPPATAKTRWRASSPSAATDPRAQRPPNIRFSRWRKLSLYGSPYETGSPRQFFVPPPLPPPLLRPRMTDVRMAMTSSKMPIPAIHGSIRSIIRIGGSSLSEKNQASIRNASPSPPSVSAGGMCRSRPPTAPPSLRD
jgi:Fe-S-cluster-containing dehydrogenase component